MPLLLPVSDSEYQTEDDMLDTLVEVRTWIREMGYNISMRISPGEGKGRKGKEKFSVYVWEGNNPKLKVSQNLSPDETIKFLNAWWSGFRYCNLHLKKNGKVPTEMPLIATHMNRGNKWEIEKEGEPDGP